MYQNCCCWTMFLKADQRICSWNLLKNALQDFVNTYLGKKYFARHLRENRQKTFITFSRFLLLRGPCSLILSIKNGEDGGWEGGGGGRGWRVFYLKIKICEARQKLFPEDPLVAGCFLWIHGLSPKVHPLFEDVKISCI